MTADNAVERSPQVRDPTLLFGRFPRAVPFIISSEFSERFSYYGMRAILVLYLVNHFDTSDNRATVFYHAFVMCCYLTSVLGGMLADSALGKFKTILYLIIVYNAGLIMLTATSAKGATGDPPSPWGAAVGLVLIAVGTGGIKPCVSSFGGDQYRPGQEHLLAGFFAAFYFSINAGSFISTLLTPKLRADVQCFGDTECFPLAFGVPTILMIVATLFFVLGSPFYIRNIPDRNIVWDTARVIGMGLKAKFCNRGGQKYEHWLDPAKKRFGEPFVSDVLAVLTIGLIFVPGIVYWALYDQQGSRWTLQAQQMKTFDMGALGRFRPDQMQAINAVLILIFIPLFEKVVFPLCQKCRVPLTPLRKIALGMTLIAASFVISGFVQISIDTAKPNLTPRHGQAEVRFINAAPWPLTVLGHSASSGAVNVNITLAANGDLSPYLSTAAGVTNLTITANGIGTTLVSIPGANRVRYTVAAVPVYDAAGQPSLSNVWTVDDNIRSKEDSADDARIRFLNGVPQWPINVAEGSATADPTVKALPSGNTSAYTDTELLSGTYTFYITAVNVTANLTVPVANISQLRLTVDDGADYTVVVVRNNVTVPSPDQQAGLVVAVRDVSGNTVSILWQIPQYIVLTASEVLYSVTVLGFAFSEAPASMKAVAQTLSLLAVAGGNLIVIIVAESSFFDEQSSEFFFFAAVMLLVMFIFAWCVRRYKYRNPQAFEQIDVNDPDRPSDTTPLIPRNTSPLLPPATNGHGTKADRDDTAEHTFA